MKGEDEKGIKAHRVRGRWPPRRNALQPPHHMHCSLPRSSLLCLNLSASLKEKPSPLSCLPAQRHREEERREKDGKEKVGSDRIGKTNGLQRRRCRQLLPFFSPLLSLFLFSCPPSLFLSSASLLFCLLSRSLFSIRFGLLVSVKATKANPNHLALMRPALRFAWGRSWPLMRLSSTTGR